eukprot:m.145152 g.145152  ORF g.145152 m.145152 type:complete len:207 (-) comp17215_c0_seq2:214-834(-)
MAKIAVAHRLTFCLTPWSFSDPNATSAWNAVISGEKRWVMLPPNVVPPGVFPSPDGAEVTTPATLFEWWTNFHDEAVAMGAIECTARRGDLVFVPSGWWHAVLNTKDSIAITQNYVSEANLAKVLRFLKHRREQVSGCQDDQGTTLHERFLAAMQQKRPELLARVLQADAEREAAAKAAKAASSSSLWGTQAKATPDQPKAFSFGF